MTHSFYCYNCEKRFSTEIFSYHEARCSICGMSPCTEKDWRKKFDMVVSELNNRSRQSLYYYRIYGDGKFVNRVTTCGNATTLQPKKTKIKYRCGKCNENFKSYGSLSLFTKGKEIPVCMNCWKKIRIIK